MWLGVSWCNIRAKHLLGCDGGVLGRLRPSEVWVRDETSSTVVSCAPWLIKD